MGIHRLPRRSRSGGFTLIELMLVSAIISVLASIAIPKFSELIRKSREGVTLGNLGAVRSAVSIYYADNEGETPYDIETLTIGGKYMDEIPRCWTYEHGNEASPYSY